MTNREVLWLTQRLPKHVIHDLSIDAQSAYEFWALPGVPRACVIAAQIVAVELGMIKIGALDKLGRAV